MSTPLKIRGIRSSKHKSAQFAEVTLFLLGENVEGQHIYALFKCELYLVKDLRANILVENNILAPEGFILNFKRDHAIVESCRVTIAIKARQRGQFPKR